MSKVEFAEMVESYAELHIKFKDVKRENKKLKVLLQVAKKEIVDQRKDILKDLNDVEIPIKEHPTICYYHIIKLIRKWEAKQ